MGFYVAHASKEALAGRLTSNKKERSNGEDFQMVFIEAIVFMILFGPKGLSKFPLISKQTAKAMAVVVIVSSLGTYVFKAAESWAVKKALPNSSWAKAVERHEDLAKHLKRSGVFSNIFPLYELPNWAGVHAKLGLK